jgi:undecaprenyl-diphosphatase
MTPPHARQRQHVARLRTLLNDTQRRRRLIIRVTLLALLCVVGLASLVRVSPVLALDVWASQALQVYPLTQLMVAVSLPGYTPWAYMVVAVVTLLVSAWLSLREGAYLLAITVGQGLLTSVIKALVGRPRPGASLVDIVIVSTDFSFPSGHVMFYSVFFGFLAILAWTHLAPGWPRRLLLGLVLALVALVGPSRMVLGAHWLSDVVAAYVLGFVLLAWAVEGYFGLRKGRRLKDEG